MPPAVTTAAVVLCQHGGNTTPGQPSTTVLAESHPLLGLGDMMTPTCPLLTAVSSTESQASPALSDQASTGRRHVFTVPVSLACFQVMATKGSGSVLVNGRPVVRQSDLVCLPNGAPAIVVETGTTTVLVGD
jgi:uncharacterized Zn-binding protein involved in type VI secretion